MNPWSDLSTSFKFEGGIYEIRPIQEEDIETLRVWKNKNKQFFCFQGTLSPEDQKKWFQEFSIDPNQQMFVCTHLKEQVACVGFRGSESELELFNLICGKASLVGKGFMKVFYKTLEEEFKKRMVKKIHLKVLENNSTAISWYQKNGFLKTAAEKNYLHLVKEPLTCG